MAVNEHEGLMADAPGIVNADGRRQLLWCNGVQGATATLAPMATTAMWFL
jgi:hypothetical protein